MRVLDHGLHDGDDEGGGRVGAAFHEDAADEAQLGGREGRLALLVENAVHEGAKVLAGGAPGFDVGEDVAVERVHAGADGFGPRDVVAEPALREPFEEGVDVDRWRRARLHNLGPRFHHRVQAVHVLGLYVRGSDTKDWMVELVKGFLAKGGVGGEVHTDGVCDTVAESFRVLHVLLRIEHVISGQLQCFGIHDLDVLLIAHLFHQVLVDQLTKCSPLVAWVPCKPPSLQFVGANKMESVP